VSIGNHDLIGCVRKTNNISFTPLLRVEIMLDIIPIHWLRT